MVSNPPLSWTGSATGVRRIPWAPRRRWTIPG